MNRLDVIFGKPADTAIDPICKMVVLKADPPGGTAEHEGETYYFCAPRLPHRVRERSRAVPVKPGYRSVRTGHAAMPCQRRCAGRTITLLCEFSRGGSHGAP